MKVENDGGEKESDEVVMGGEEEKRWSDAGKEEKS